MLDLILFQRFIVLHTIFCGPTVDHPFLLRCDPLAASDPCQVIVSNARPEECWRVQRMNTLAGHKKGCGR